MIVAVIGGKGGVGKTTSSFNLARETEAVVVDADLATPDLPRGRGPDLHDVLAGRTNPLEAVERFGAMRILPSGRTLEGARAADLSRLPRVLDVLDRQYGRVVVDCPAGLARDIGTVLHAADVAVLVTTPSKPALVNAYQTWRVANDVGTPLAAVALNRAETKDHERIAERVESEFGVPTVVVPDRDDIAAAQASFDPVRDAYEDGVAVEAFATLARTVEECQRERLDEVAGG